MAESDTFKPIDDGDAALPPTSEHAVAAPLKDEPGDTPAGKIAEVKQTIGGGASSLQQQATDKVRMFAEDGKERAGGALDQLAQMLIDAATQVDEKLGAQYGDHARNAAQSVQGFATAVRDKDIDELAADVRGYISKSPAAAVGVTAALGFALARMVHAGLDQRG